MTLEREANVDLGVAGKPNNLTRVQGDRLIIAAPPRLQKLLKPISPKIVKEKIAKPTFEHGWNEVSDPKAQAEMKRKMKSEDPKNIPPPSIKPREKADTGTPAVSGNPAATEAPATFNEPALSPPGKHKDERAEKPAPGGSSSSQASPGISGSAPDAGLPERSTHPLPTRNKSSQQSSPSNLASLPDGTPVREPLNGKPKDKPKAAQPHQEAPPAGLPKRPLPPERVALPSREARPDVPRQRPLPPERVAPPVSREARPDVPRQRPLPPEQVAPPVSREALPDAPRQRPLPPERVAPPPGPGSNGPVKIQAPPSKRGPDKTTTEPSPRPGS